jgi:MFS family permease
MLSRPRNLIQLSLLYLPLNLFWTAMLLLLLPARVEAVAGDQKGVVLAVVNSCGAIAASLCMFLVGPLSDNTTHRFGRRFPWVVWGVLIGAAGALIFPFARTLPILLFAFVLARLGLAAAVAAYEAILPDRIPVEFQSRASGWNEMFDVVGMFAGLAYGILFQRGATNALMGTYLSAEVEQEVATFLICGGSVFLLAGVLLANQNWIREAPLPIEKAISSQQSIRSAFAWRPSEAPEFFNLYLSRCVLNLGIFTGVDYLFYYVQEVLPPGNSDVAREVLLIALYVSLGGIIGALVGGRMGDLFPKRAVLYFFCSISALAAIGFCFAGSIEVARLLGFFYGIGSSAINTVDWAFATSLVPRGKEARYLAIFHTSFHIPGIAVGVGGFIGQYYSYRTLFWTIPFWLIVGMVLLARVPETKVVPASSH